MECHSLTGTAVQNKPRSPYPPEVPLPRCGARLLRDGPRKGQPGFPNEHVQSELRARWAWFGHDSSACYRRSCRQCGAVFFSRRPAACLCGYGCSKQCVKDRRKKNRAAALSGRRKTCPACGGPVLAGRSDAKYCAAACKQKAYRSVTAKHPSAKSKDA